MWVLCSFSSDNFKYVNKFILSSRNYIILICFKNKQSITERIYHNLSVSIQNINHPSTILDLLH